MMTTDKSSKVPIELIDRFLSGECTPNEIAIVRAWANEEPERSALLLQLRAIDDHAVSIIPNRRDPAIAWERFREGRGYQSVTPRPNGTDEKTAELAATRKTGGGLSFFRLPFSSPGQLAGAAACLIVGVILAISTFRQESGHRGSFALSAAEYTIYTTKAGERTTISLRDGTKVILNVASRLEVPREFGETTRAVRVTGQAVFEVAHAKDIPFIVDAAGTRTTVLGTRFSVRAYDANVRVAVESGRISFVPCDVANDRNTCRERQDQVILSANNIAAVDPSGRMRVSTDTLVDHEFAFSTGQLVLTGTSLGEARESLERWYGVDIILADSSLNQLSLEGAFPAGSVGNLNQALEVILKVQVRQDGRVITVFPRRSANPPLPRSE